MKPPKFWMNKEPGTTERIAGRIAAQIAIGALSPLAGLYRLGAALRSRFTSPYQASCPVVCIGNISLGGTGKTPTALWLAEALRGSGAYQTPFIVSRGYGGKEKGPRSVRPNDQAALVGDEPLLFARHYKTIIAKSKTSGVELAEAEAADIILLDDGMQNPSVVKDFTLCIIDGPRGFGNGHTFPAGPLREPINVGLARADAALIIGPHDQNLMTFMPGDLPVFTALLDLNAEDITALKGTKIIGFCGIGVPEKFRMSLSQAGADLCGFTPFPDHYLYKDQDLDRLAETAAKQDAMLVTTEKDWVRLSPLWQKKIRPIRAWLHVDQADALLSLILRLRT